MGGDEVLLTKFIDYLGCGRIERSLNRDAVNFAVSKFSDIKEKIIPRGGEASPRFVRKRPNLSRGSHSYGETFFQSYPLHGVKYWDYCDFVKVANIMEDKGHFTTSIH